MSILEWFQRVFRPVSFAEKKAVLDRLYNEMMENQRLQVWPPYVVKFADEKGITDREAALLLKAMLPKKENPL